MVIAGSKQSLLNFAFLTALAASGKLSVYKPEITFGLGDKVLLARFMRSLSIH